MMILWWSYDDNDDDDDDTDDDKNNDMSNYHNEENDNNVNTVVDARVMNFHVNVESPKSVLFSWSKSCQSHDGTWLTCAWHSLYYYR